MKRLKIKPVCGKSFSRAPDLNEHVLSVHENIRNYKCTICEYAASSSSNLRKHIEVVHEKLKKHKCNECSKQFGQTSGYYVPHEKYVLISAGSMTK